MTVIVGENIRGHWISHVINGGTFVIAGRFDACQIGDLQRNMNFVGEDLLTSIETDAEETCGYYDFGAAVAFQYSGIEGDGRVKSRIVVTASEV